MSLSTRMLPLNGSGGTVTGYVGSPENPSGGRFYSVTGGQVVDVPDDPSGDASGLTSQGFVLVCMSGPTSSRPNGLGFLKPGALYIDTSLNAVLCWDGLAWRNVLTGATA